MLSRILLFLLGFILMVIGFSYLIIYLNLITFGYTILEYLQYIFTHLESLLLFIGIIIISYIILTKEKKNGLYKWYYFKLFRWK